MADLLIEEVSVLLNVIGQEVGLRANQKNITVQCGVQPEEGGGGGGGEREPTSQHSLRMTYM